jgi:UDP-glucose 4-epimerase
VKALNAVVIGSNGYLGRHLAHALATAGHRVIPCGRQARSADGWDGYRQLDVCVRDSLDAIDADADMLFLCAGLSGTGVGFTRYEDFVRSNEVGLLNVLDRVRACGARARVVFPSSRLVYRGVRGARLDETAAKEPRTVYAVTKVACESLLWVYQNRFGIPYTVFRICVPYGSRWPDSYAYGTLGFLLGRAARGEPIVLFGDGSQRRTFSHIEDVCRQLVQSASMADTRNAVFNVGGEDLSLLEVGGAIARQYGVDLRCEPWPEGELSLESGDTVFDSTRLDALTGYRRMHTFSEWLARL